MGINQAEYISKLPSKAKSTKPGDLLEAIIQALFVEIKNQQADSFEGIDL